MHAVRLHLPLKASEAGVLAGLIVEQCSGRKLNDDLRNRLNARILGLRLSSIAPCVASLEHGPIHPATWYLAVDTRGARPEPLLLRIALASAPASGLFPNAMLIGRMRIHTGEETVVNAISFSPADHTHIRTFAEQVNTDFLPRSRGAAPAIAIEHDHPATGLPLAFEAWRGLHRSTGASLASIIVRGDIETGYTTAVWAAIRSGWRKGYGVEVQTDQIESAAGCTKFTIELQDLDDAELGRAVELYDRIRTVRKEFDFEVALPGAKVEEQDLARCLQVFKAQGRPVQFVRPADDPARLAEVARRFGAIVTVTQLDSPALQRMNYALRATGDPAPLIYQAADRMRL